MGVEAAVVRADWLEPNSMSVVPTLVLRWFVVYLMTLYQVNRFYRSEWYEVIL
jgi:hypothetical protein